MLKKQMAIFSKDGSSIHDYSGARHSLFCGEDGQLSRCNQARLQVLETAPAATFRNGRRGFEDHILKEFDDNDKRYGYRCYAQGLAKTGFKVCKDRVDRLTNEMSLKARASRKLKVTTDSHHKKPVLDDLINQNFAADRPEEKYVSDITYIRTREGWLYLRVALDLFSKMFVGHSFRGRMKATLFVNAIKTAPGKGRSLKDCIFHSDRVQPVLQRRGRKNSTALCNASEHGPNRLF